MRRRVTSLIAVAVLLGVPRPLVAQSTQLFPPPATPIRWGNFDVTSSLEAGYRSLTVDKNAKLFAHDYKLDDGPRLFTFSLTGRSDGGKLDLFTVDLSNLGDPFQAARATARKTGRFTAAVGVRSIDRFYQYDAPRADQVTEYRLFDTTRRIYDGAFDVVIPRVAKVGAEYRRTVWTGPGSITTRDWSRDEYDVTANYDAVSSDFRIWGERRLGGTSLLVEQTYRKFRNSTDYQVSGPTEGHNTTGRSALSNFIENNPQDARIPTTAVRVRSAISNRVDIAASYLYSQAKVDFTGSLDATGLDFSRRPAVEQQTFAGDARKNDHVFDGAVSIGIRDGLVWHNNFRYRRYDLDGAVDVTEMLQVGTALPTSTFEEVLGNRIEFRAASYWPEIEYVPVKSVTIRGGARVFSRDVKMFDEGQLDEDASTTGARATTGVVGFVSVAIRPSARYRIIGELERGAVENALTRISPLSTRRIKVRGQADLGGGFKLSGSFVDRNYRTEEISTSTWRSGSAWVSFVRNGRFVLDAGYTRQQIDLSTATVFFAPAQTEGFSVYDVGTDILFSQAEVKVHRRVAVNGGYQVVRSSGTYATTFDRATLGSTMSLSERYYVSATVWSGGYREREAVTLGNFDYDFTQLLVNFGYRF